MENQITFSDIRGVYTKDFDTFGKMDPFLEFQVGKSKAKTDVAHDAGMEPKWKQPIKLTYFDEKVINLKSFDDDPTSQDQMGAAEIQISKLKANGEIELKIVDEKGNQTGTVYANYIVKSLPKIALLVVKNIKCNFYKDTDFVIKSKPFFSLEAQGIIDSTQPKKQGSRQLQWAQSLRIKIADGSDISFSLKDQNDKGNDIFVYGSKVKQFKTVTGNKVFHVFDKDFEPLGTLTFDFETFNFVSKEESVKNEEKAKNELNQCRQILFSSIKGNLKQDIKDLYFKINVGQNNLRTIIIKKADKNFSLDLMRTLYAENSENKITFSAFEEKMIGDELKGSGDIYLESLTEGNNIVKLTNKSLTHFGDITVNINSKKTALREIELSNVAIKIAVSADIIGDSDMYVVGQIGGWSSRTETTTGKEVTFSKNLKFKYSSENQLKLIIKDEDFTKDDLMYTVILKLDELKNQGEHTLPLIPEKYKDDPKNHGSLSFKYSIKNKLEKPAVIKKASEKKIEVVENQKKEEKKQIPEQKQEQAQNHQPQNNKKVIEDQKVDLNLKQKKEQMKSIADRTNKSVEKSGLESSKNTFKLPSISDSKNYGDKIYDKQSSATLQKSILVFSMPKAGRFGSGPKYSGEPSYYVDSCFKPNSGKGAGFGFGSKKQFPEWMERNMKQNPAPGSYFDQRSPDSEFRAKGPTFGIPYKYYEKVTIPSEKKKNQPKNPALYKR